jgi:uncharacterized protein
MLASVHPVALWRADMKPPVIAAALGLLFAALLAACAPESPAHGPAPGVATPAVAGATSVVAAATSSTALPAIATSADAGPAFDCAVAADTGERLVCSDPALAALDRQLAAVYADALTAPGADTATLKATQRGWIRGRADCWKADDKPTCVREAYLTRLVELQLAGGKVVVPAAVEFRCDDDSKPFTVVYYNDLDPKAAVITWGDDQAIAFPKPAASGARYGREGLDFWEHQGVATVDFYGNKLRCKPVR